MATPTRVNGLQKTGEAGSSQSRKAFSWMDPHLKYAGIIVGPEGDQSVFGIQKDLLNARSEYFRRQFEAIEAEAEAEGKEKIEYVITFSDVSPRIFGYVQHYLYTNGVWPESAGELPTYEEFVAVWQFGHKHEVDGLCDKTMEAMSELKEKTRQIPGASLVTKVWDETPDDAPIRQLFLQWAREYFATSDDPSAFARSLPQAFLSELVLTMSSSPTPTAPAPSTQSPAVGGAPRKNVHYLDEDENDEDPEAILRGPKKNRKSTGAMAMPPPGPVQRGPAPAASPANRRVSLPVAPKKSGPGRRASGAAGPDVIFTEEQKVNFCADLLSRMLSGPGYWTRLVKPFKHPVDPANDGVPDYLEKVKNPMDLTTINAKMAAGEYATAEAFASDVQLIVDNCKLYWRKGNPLYAEAEKFEKSFKEKFAEMNKWLTKMGGHEGV